MSLSVIFDWMKKTESEHIRVLKSKWISLMWGFVLFASSLLPYYLSGKMSDGLVEVGLKIASFTFGPLIALFLLVRVKDRLALQLSSQLLVTSLFISLMVNYRQKKPWLLWKKPLKKGIFFLSGRINV